MAHRIGVIADDSMLGRDTPSKGLELTAKYIADQFKSFGLEPGGEDGTWFQRYPITRRRMELDSSRVVFRIKNAVGDGALRPCRALRAGSRAGRPGQRAGDTGGRSGDSGRHRADGARGEGGALRSGLLGQIPVNATQVGRAIRLAGPKAIVMLSNLDSVAFARRIPRTAPERTSVDLRLNSPVVVEVTEKAIPPVLEASRGRPRRGAERDRARGARPARRSACGWR